MIFPSAGVQADELALPPSMHGRRLRRRFHALGPDAPARRLHELGAGELASASC
ncbi:MAG TPA: hypothetical protein VF746_25335 [Longimicrobium sp.]